MYRSLLFVPGDRPERFAKAVASGADAVCIDLEDAVSPANKRAARNAALDYLELQAGRKTAVGLRVNAIDRLDGFRDIIALCESKARPAFVLAPKVRSREPVDQIRTVLGENAPPIWALVETPQALLGVASIAAGVGPDGGVVFGGADLSAALGSDMSWDSLYFARAAIIAGAAMTLCQTLDVPYLDVRDLSGMIEETRRVKAMGFTGRSCIHPDQVAAINEIYTPTIEEIEKAQALIDAYENNAGRVLLHEGRLVEKPVLAAARRILSRRKRA
ncbi:MAG: HpcH/HpaI aldolase/citrate lyase family protein [Pseudomonadota bacterium]